MNSLLPGQATLIFNRNSIKNSDSDKLKFGFRIPNNKFIAELLKYINEPLAIVNMSPRPLHIFEFEILWNDIDLIVDGNLLGFEDDPKARFDSTVVDLSIPGTYKILRQGTFFERTIQQLEKKCKLVVRKI